MITKVIPIGNIKGVSIPDLILDKCHIKDNVQLEVRNGEIIIKPLGKKPRDNWDQAFQMMHENGDDELLIDDGLDLGDWE